MPQRGLGVGAGVYMLGIHAPAVCEDTVAVTDEGDADGTGYKICAD